MSWGVLNSRRGKTSAKPLPGFLLGQASKDFHDRSDSQFQNTEDVVVRTSGRQQHTPRQELNRGYGVAHSGSINIQLSRQTVFVSAVFCAMLILVTFCAGYIVGNLSVVSSGQMNAHVPIKKTIIPIRKMINQEVRAAKKNIEAVATEAEPAEPFLGSVESSSSDQEESPFQVSSEKNNNKENDSETIDDAPQSAADENDVAD
jgi:hypothetical protein